MGIFHDPDDPLSVFLLPPPGESPQDRILREQKEAEEKRNSDLIDENIRREKNALRKQNLVRVLLLGQAESGKSTTLKNFRVKYAYNDWVRERVGWRSVIQLNLIRSILTIIDTLRAEIGSTQASPTPSLTRISTPYRPDDSDASSTSSSSTMDDTEYLQAGSSGAGGGLIHLSEHVKTLLLILGPLRAVERELKLRLGAASDEVRAEDAVVDPSQVYVTPFDHPAPRSRPPKEFSVTRWNNVLEAAAKFGRASKLPPKSAGKAQVLDEPTEVIFSCREDMKLLWADETVRSVLQKRNIHMEHSAGFFLEDLDRIATRDYEPTDDDILRARLRTVGVQEYRLRIDSGGRGSADWVFYDVGGARTMRATWIPFFDNINAIIFLAPVSTFNERLLEDPKVNRFEDSVLLWKSICSSKLLAKVTLVLFLNKCDILKRKLKKGVQVGKYLSSYGNRPNDPATALKYIKEKFILILEEVSPNPDRAYYCHATTVIDMKATFKTLRAVQDGILRENLRYAELV